MRVLPFALLLGCHGESVSSSTPVDSAATDVSAETIADAPATDTSDAESCDLPGNLIRNGSFEIGDTTPALWLGPVQLKTVSGGAFHCAKYARWTTTEGFGEFDQSFNLPAKAPKGTVFDVSFYAKSLDGNTDQFLVSFQPFGMGPMDQPTSALSGSMWTKLTVTFVLEAETDRISLAIRNPSPAGRDTGFDLVVVTQK